MKNTTTPKRPVAPAARLRPGKTCSRPRFQPWKLNTSKVSVRLPLINLIFYWKPDQSKKLTDATVIPDVMSTENGTKVVKWEGSWSYISTIPWIKVSSAGKAAPADFPSKGIN